MITLIFLFFVVGIILIIFNTIKFDFIHDQENVAWQRNLGYVLVTLSLLLLFHKMVIMNTEWYQEMIDNSYKNS